MVVMRRFRWYPAPLAHVVDDFEGDTSERLAGRVTVPAVKDPDRPPFVYLFAFALRRRPPKGCDESIRCVGDPDPDSIPEDDEGCAVLPKGQPLFWAKAGKRWHAARMETDPDHHNRLFLRAGDCIEIARDLDNAPFYARVYHLRKWLLLLPLAIAALLLCLTLTFCGSGSGGSSLGFLDGQKSTGETSQPVVSIDYASYDASVDSTWKADSLTQDFKLSLPATCTHEGETGGNPVDSSPSVYVDLDGNGAFDDSECVYNAPDESGYGKLLAAGSEVDSIELNQKVPAGEYSAMTVWRSVLASDHSQSAGQSSFTWALTVE